MLKSTHRVAQAPRPDPAQLPEGWTEHKAPTGHTYYYHAATNTSTYARPAVASETPAQPSFVSKTVPQGVTYSDISTLRYDPLVPGSHQHDPLAASRRSAPSQQLRRREGPPDRPKSKKPIPECAPWILVYTKLRRRFVYNPETGESLWKFPQDVMLKVIDMDHKERVRRERIGRGEPAESESEAKAAVKTPEAKPESAQDGPAKPPANGKTADYDSDEYEEVEVTDDEDEGEEARKRPKLDNDETPGPVEFNEDDIAFQLAAMGQDEGAEEGMDWEGGYEEEPLNEDDAKALFIEMLEDFHISPFKPWESLVEDGTIVDDERYTCLPNMKSRKEVWAEWSRAKMQRIREQKQQQERTDPRIPYMTLLQQHATPKLYWPEFRRKFRKEAAMRDGKVSDKDREKWYREYINRLKLPEATLKADLTALLKAQPLAVLHRATSLEALPPALLTDLRYVSVPPRVRDPLVEAYIAIQPAAPTDQEDGGSTVQRAKDQEERARRERALAEREQRVQDEKLRAQRARERGREMLREEEEEVERAMRVSREGLKGQVKVEE